MKFLPHLIFILVISTSCDSQSRRLDDALKIAGENRGELEKVIAHYSKNVNDSLKLKAAYFLIENMPGHYSYKGDDIMKYYTEIDSVLDSEMLTEDIRLKMENIAIRYPQLNNDLIEDIKIISSDFLIHNIDSAFKLWKKPWASHLSFYEFCESILPYKCTELQQLDYWRDSLAVRFITKYDKGYKGEHLFHPYPHYCQIMEKIKEKVEHKEITSNYNCYQPLSASNIHKLRFGYCDDYLTLLIAVMRSKGIPVVREYFPRWGNKTNCGHSWVSLINKAEQYLPALWGFSSLPGDPFIANENIPKAFRTTYAHNPKVLEYLKQTKYICPEINVFSIDITDKCTGVSDLYIPVNTKKLKDKYVYISMFSGGQWFVVDYGIVKQKKALFSNIGRGIVYIVYGYDGKKLIPVSDPFILSSDGNVKYLKADANNLTTVVVDRKYPSNDFLDWLKNVAIGGEIHASNSVDFKQFEKICIVDSLSVFIPVSSSRPYRFWRYFSKPYSWCNIAELHFFETGNEDFSKGKIIGNMETRDKFSPKNAFDGNWLTSCYHIYESGGWIGLDLGKEVCINRVRCVPRSDDNWIHPGDTYELKYWENSQWKSLGTQTAERTILQFDSVPNNAVLWLSNLTQGKEERIFTYENGKQVWW